MSYVPFEPGTYHVNVKYADGHVTGSPFTVDVLEGVAEADAERGDAVVRRRQRLLQLVTREREAASVAQVGTLCEMNIALPASQKEPFELSAWVRAPSGHFEKCDVSSPDRRNFVIRFTPHEVGVHQVEIRLNGIGIPGSPFLFTVGSPTSGTYACVLYITVYEYSTVSVQPVAVLVQSTSDFSHQLLSHVFNLYYYDYDYATHYVLYQRRITRLRVERRCSTGARERRGAVARDGEPAGRVHNQHARGGRRQSRDRRRGYSSTHTHTHTLLHYISCSDSCVQH